MQYVGMWCWEVVGLWRFHTDEMDAFRFWLRQGEESLIRLCVVATTAFESFYDTLLGLSVAFWG